MVLAKANAARARITAQIMELFTNAGEDCALIASNSFNFPIVEDGDEGWIEVVVKVPKEEEGFEKREEYQIKLREKAEKAAAAEAAKKKKMERDAAARAAKAAKKTAEN